MSWFFLKYVFKNCVNKLHFWSIWGIITQAVFLHSNDNVQKD
jgi:hypothetical protein